MSNFETRFLIWSILPYAQFLHEAAFYYPGQNNWTTKIFRKVHCLTMFASCDFLRDHHWSTQGKTNFLKFKLCDNVDLSTKANITWYHMISHDITWYPMISHDITWYHMISHDITWYHMISHDVTWYHMISHDITWYHMHTTDRVNSIYVTASFMDWKSNHQTYLS